MPYLYPLNAMADGQAYLELSAHLATGTRPWTLMRAIEKQQWDIITLLQSLRLRQQREAAHAPADDTTSAAGRDDAPSSTTTEQNLS
jgi:hypothetical protein